MTWPDNPAAVPPDLWKSLTTTVGLISVRHPTGVNVMAAEWTYFVNKDPLYVAVVLSPRAETRRAIESAGTFCVTLCAEDQAELADFAGSFSMANIDKTSSELLQFGEPVAGVTPWVRGGTLSMECTLRSTLDLPVHRMFVGEVLAAHRSEEESRPLIKRGRMATLGGWAQRSAVVAAAEVRGGVLRVCATGPGDPELEWTVSLTTRRGQAFDFGGHPSAQHGDFEVELAPPPELGDLQGARVRVGREEAQPGFAIVP